MIQLPTMAPTRPGPGRDNSDGAPPRLGPPPAAQPPLPGSQRAAQIPGQAPRPGSNQQRTPRQKTGVFGNNKGKTRLALDEFELRRLRGPVRSPRRIAVVGLKGGVGKTTLSVLLAGIYARLRAEPVLLLDADPTFGSLLLRSGVAPMHSAHDLAGRGDPGDFNILAPYLALSASGPWVLPSGLDPGQSARFDEATFVATMDVVHRHFPVTVIDCGAGLSGGLMRQLLGSAHTLVFATSPSIDGLTATYAGLRWIAEHGFGALVSNSYVAVSAVPKRNSPVDLGAAARRFQGVCRGLLTVPDDQHLRSGARIDHSELGPDAAHAMLHVAAEVFEAALRA